MPGTDIQGKIADPLKSLIVPIDTIWPDPKNARQHPPRNLEAIKRSLTYYGQRKPVVVNELTGIIEAGNGLWTAAKEMGWTEIAALQIKDDPTTAAAYAVMDNQSAILAEWDLPTLKDTLQELDSGAFDMDLTGFLEDEINDLMMQFREPGGGLTDDDAVPEVPESVCKKGDLWILGEHKLLCGDATVITDVERLMGGEKADMVFTDPPYGVMYKSAKKNAISGDLSQATIPLAFRGIIESATDKNARLYLCGGSGNAKMYLSLFDSYCQQIPHLLVWVKETFVMRPNNYHSQYEIVYFGWKGKGGSPEFWYGDRKQSDVWQFHRDKSADYLHPTQKPVVLCETAVGYSCAPNGIVYDPFGGSGSTLIACEKLNRKCRMMEIDEHYCDVIIKRWEDYTGEKAVLDGSAS